MRFGDEDNVLTATEALVRSFNGFDDSKDREMIRQIMKRIKYSSFYGHRQVSIRGLDVPMSDKVKDALKSLGYRFHETERSRSVGLKSIYSFDIEW